MNNGGQANGALERWGARFVVGVVLLIGVVGVSGLVLWNDIGATDVVDTAAAATLARGAAVATLVLAVLALPFALRPGVLPWALPAVLSVAAIALVVGWRAAGTGSGWGTVQIVAAVGCGLAAVAAVLTVPGARPATTRPQGGT